MIPTVPQATQRCVPGTDSRLQPNSLDVPPKTPSLFPEPASHTALPGMVQSKGLTPHSMSLGHPVNGDEKVERSVTGRNWV